MAYAKANPGKVTAASIGPTSTHHLGLEWLKSLTGVDMLVVPYRGVAPGLTALVAGEVQLMFMGSGVADDYVATGRTQLPRRRKQKIAWASYQPFLRSANSAFRNSS